VAIADGWAGAGCRVLRHQMDQDQYQARAAGLVPAVVRCAPGSIPSVVVSLVSLSSSPHNPPLELLHLLEHRQRLVLATRELVELVVGVGESACERTSISHPPDHQ